jgi:hypothetical protein
MIVKILALCPLRFRPLLIRLKEVSQWQSIQVKFCFKKMILKPFLPWVLKVLNRYYGNFDFNLVNKMLFEILNLCQE